MNLFFTSIFQNLLTVIIFYFIGNFALSISKLKVKKGFSHYFFSLLCGFLISVTVYAIIITGFQTSLLAVLPVVIWGLYKRNAPGNYHEENIKQYSFPVIFCLSLIMLTGISAIFFHKYVGFSDPFNSISWFHADSVFYANVAAHLNTNGFENYMFHTNSSSIKFYHYTEIWLTSLLNRAMGGTYILTYIFQTVPVLIFILWVGFIAIAETVIRDKSLLYYFLVSLFCFIAAPLGDMIIPFSKFMKGDLFEFGFALYYKLAVIQLFIVGIVLVRKNISNAIGFALLLSFYYPTTLPAIYILIYLYLVYEIIKNKKVTNENLKLAAASLLSLLILILLLMTFHETEPSEVKKGMQGLFETYIGSVSKYIRTGINIVGSTVLNISAAFIPYILLGFMIWKKLDKSLLIIGAALILAQFMGLFSWALLSSVLDSVQLWSNIYSCAINTIIFVLVIAAISDKRIYVRLFVIWIILANAYFHNPVTTSRHEASPGEIAIIKKVKTLKDPKFVFLRDPSEFKNIFMYNTIFTIPAVYLSFYVNSYKPVCINPISVAKTHWEKKFISNSPFIVYSKNKNLPVEQLQLEYIQNNNIDFLITSEITKVPEFIPSITDTIIFDETNKLKFYVLK